MLRLTRDGVQLASVPVSRASSWPFAVPEPVMPTGLTLVSGASDPQITQDGVEYRNSLIDTTIKRKRIVLRDCRIHWLNVDAPAEDVWIVGGEIGPCSPGHPMVAPGAVPAVAKRVVFDAVHVHGMHQANGTDHTEGIQVGGVDTLVIRNCTFEDNHVFNVFLRCWAPAPIRYVLIEDNDLGQTGLFAGGSGSYSLRVAGDGDSTQPTDVVIRRNRIRQPISVDGSAVRVVLGAGADANVVV